jgi:TPR repeat protein
LLQKIVLRGFLLSVFFFLHLNLGILLNEGLIPGIDINPQLAVVWWRRCVDTHGHINATYELATAYYLAEGVAENATSAVRYFRRAANLGHP